MMKKPGYKHTQFGWIPEEWEVKELKDIACKPIVYGIVQAGPHVEDGIPYIKSSDVGGKIIVSSLCRTSFSIAEKYKRSFVCPGDIVFSLRGNIGELSVVPDELPYANLTQGTARINVPSEKANYIKHALTGPALRKGILAKAKGSTFQEISLEQLRLIQIPLPSNKEQFILGKILSTWDEAIIKQQQLIEALQTRHRALMQQLLTGKKRLKGFKEEWREVRLESLLSRLGNGINYDPENTQGLPVTRIETISAGNINFNKIGFADPFNNQENYRLKHGDILYSHINSLSHIGKIAIYLDKKPLYHGMNLLLLRAKENTNSYFIYYWLNSTTAKKIAQRIAKPAVNQASISTADLGNTILNIPSLLEQNAIANILSTSEKEVQAHRLRLTALQEQKKGLMQVLLTGKVRVKV